MWDDIIFTAPRFKDGTLETLAYVTVLQNGVAVQNHTEILGDTGHRILATYVTKASEGPLKLQDHGNKTRFRNIWVRVLGNNRNN
ncbi:MAG: family 16 glycoside hydrolase [Terriglobia bacterium]